MPAAPRVLLATLACGVLAVADGASRAAAQPAAGEAPRPQPAAWRTPPCATATLLTAENALPEDVDVVEVAASGRRQTLVRRVGTGTVVVTLTPKPNVEYAVRRVGTPTVPANGSGFSLAAEPRARWVSAANPADKRVRIARACAAA